MYMRLMRIAGAFPSYRKLTLAADHRSDISVLSRVPVLDLAITIIGVPAAVALVGWVLAARRLPATRQALV
jgi:hypothetical protein